MRQIFDAFTAFNINGINNLIYVISTNWWYILIALSAVITVVLFLKAEIEITVHEEQQIL